MSQFLTQLEDLHQFFLGRRPTFSEACLLIIHRYPGLSTQEAARLVEELRMKRQIVLVP
jgi:hypothetical protein